MLLLDPTTVLAENTTNKVIKNPQIAVFSTLAWVDFQPGSGIIEEQSCTGRLEHRRRTDDLQEHEARRAARAAGEASAARAVACEAARPHRPEAVGRVMAARASRPIEAHCCYCGAQETGNRDGRCASGFKHCFLLDPADLIVAGAEDDES